jgi:hypothetical protein
VLGVAICGAALPALLRDARAKYMRSGLTWIRAAGSEPSPEPKPLCRYKAGPRMLRVEAAVGLGHVIVEGRDAALNALNLSLGNDRYLSLALGMVGVAACLAPQRC